MEDGKKWKVEEGCSLGVENGRKWWKVKDRCLVELLVLKLFCGFGWMGKVMESDGKWRKGVCRVWKMGENDGKWRIGIWLNYKYVWHTYFTGLWRGKWWKIEESSGRMFVVCVENGGKCWKVEDRYLVELLVCMTYLLYRFCERESGGKQRKVVEGCL